MKHKLPEDLSVLNRDELSELLSNLITQYAELSAKGDEEITDQDIADLEATGAAIDAVNAKVEEVDGTAKARAEKLAALRGRELPADSDEDDDEDEGDEDPDSEDEPDEDTESEEDEDEPADKAEKKEPVMASAKPKRSVIARVHSDTKVDVPQVEVKRGSITAAADVPGFASGATLGDFHDVAKAFGARAKGFQPSKAAVAQAEANPGRWQKSHANDGLRRFGLAQITKPENEFTLEAGMSMEKQFEILDKLLDEKRLPGGSLVAAGGWCAPSETVYDFGPQFESIDGILSIPEVNISRGGINFTSGPSYSALAADWGFLQTEAQAEAGTEKVCYAVDCPDFTDHRLDAIGFCITAGILTNVGYPELIQRVLQIGATAHAHKVNASVISRLVTLAGTAINWTEIGSGVGDLVNALDYNAEVIRYSLSMAVGASLEVVLPAWARLVARQDIAVRNGGTPADALKVSDADVQQYFALRGLNVQFVYDWQPLTTTGGTVGQAMPTTVNALIYPAGAVFKGTTPVIDLDAVYDSVGLSTNTYNAAFFEEGLLVAQRGGLIKQVAIGLNYTGATGYPVIGGAAFEPAAA